MRHCERCGFLGVSGYEYPESYCIIGIQEDDPKFDEDKEGCGCHYNIRTLRKMKKENDHAEYLYYLMYSDYSLIPTMEYTEENEIILERHRELMRHAIGLDYNKPYIRHGKRFYKPKRNYFKTNSKSVEYTYWERLLNAKLADKKEDGENICYFVNHSGIDWLGQHDGIHIYYK